MTSFLQTALESMLRQFDKPGQKTEEQEAAIVLGRKALSIEATKPTRGEDVKRYKVYAVRQSKDKDDLTWVPAGTAWRNRDGTMSVYLDVLPLDGKLTFRE